MPASHQSIIAHDDVRREISFRGILLGIILAVVLAASNTYLALKIGILTSASIPAAVLAMGILRFFKGSNILENNLVQTCASAGEAIAGGIVYTIPALIIIHYWTHFGYLHNLMVALIGGILGVLFSVPLRRVLIADKHLRFPEAQAITKLLEMGERTSDQLRYMVSGGILGAVIEFAQSGLQMIASSVQKFFAVGKTLIGFGSGFSATLIGAGYLIGFNVGLSLFIGAITGWLILVPILSGVYHLTTSQPTATAAAQDLWGNYVRFVGIGSMLTAGIWTLLTLVKPIWAGIQSSFSALTLPAIKKTVIRTERDVPLLYVAAGILISLIISYFLLKDLLPLNNLGLPSHFTIPLLISSALFILIIGFIFAAICGYFSGMVGVSASPGSAIVIGGLMLVAFGLHALLNSQGVNFTQEIIKNACAVVIVLISVVTGIACITNDNIQDLKVGHLVGSTPWKQQLMLLIGVLAASAVIPLLMQLLFSVYGLGGVYPHAGMDPSRMLPAPVPSVLATVTQAVFDDKLPLTMLLLGVAITIGFILFNVIFKKRGWHLSILGISMGLYLPLSSSTPLFIGSIIALLMQRVATKNKLKDSNQQRGILLACGLVAGAALMDVLLAIPFAISGNPNVLSIMPASAHDIAIGLGILSILFLSGIFYRAVRRV